jgi:hypothetical protein
MPAAAAALLTVSIRALNAATYTSHYCYQASLTLPLPLPILHFYYSNGWFATDRHGLCDSFKNKGATTFDPTLELAKVVCADKLSDFKDTYAKYSAGFLSGDDSLFKAKFCQAFQAMGTIGLNMPTDYDAVAIQFLIK